MGSSKLLGITALFSLSSVYNVEAASQKSPNVIVIMADDLGYNDLGFQGSSYIKTPNLDKLAYGGMIFTDAHVSASVCSPSRAGFITGRYQQRFGHESNCPPHKFGLDNSVITIADAMKKQGYTTAVFGKWHLGEKDIYYPTKRGFDEFWGFRGGSRIYWYNNKKADSHKNCRRIEHNGKDVKFEGYLTDWLANTTVKFIDKNKDKKFFIYLAFNAPHGPLQAKKEMIKKYKGNIYAAMIASLDEGVGLVIDSLKRNNLLDNTMIWFLSDNGGIAKQSSNKPLKGTKGTLFEGGMRVPFFLYWNGVIKPGSKYNKMISSLDIFPTTINAVGGKVLPEWKLDGVNILPYILGKKKGSPDVKFAWRRSNTAAVRNGKWKLIRVDGKFLALYNVVDDLKEKHNCLREKPEMVSNLKKQLAKWEAQMKKPLWNEPAKWVKWRTVMHNKLVNEK